MICKGHFIVHSGHVQSHFVLLFLVSVWCYIYTRKKIASIHSWHTGYHSQRYVMRFIIIVAMLVACICVMSVLNIALKLCLVLSWTVIVFTGDNYSEFDIVSLNNLGELGVYSVVSLRRQLLCPALRKEDIKWVSYLRRVTWPQGCSSKLLSWSSFWIVMKFSGSDVSSP